MSSEIREAVATVVTNDPTPPGSRIRDTHASLVTLGAFAPGSRIRDNHVTLITNVTLAQLLGQGPARSLPVGVITHA